ncbi:MAG: hypothetical protein QMD04_14855, partial [Anaerolineales bacterium]|nr:hypothetical protein [Anaerolineales bacterium]
REVTRELKLKESFKKTEFYKYGVVWLNDRQPKDYQSVQSFADLGLKKRNYAQFEDFVSAKDWFAFNTIYGTGEEKAFLRMMDRQMQKLQTQYEQIYLLRNEGHFAIYNFVDGQAFQPDFVLFLREKGGKLLIYQLFIEPKGKHLKEHDRWKETFLKEIISEFCNKPLMFKDKNYRLIGVPFYNNEDENQFRVSLESVLNYGA